MQNRHNFSVHKYDQLPINAQLVYAKLGECRQIRENRERALCACVNEMEGKKGSRVIKRPNDAIQHKE